MGLWTLSQDRSYYSMGHERFDVLYITGGLVAFCTFCTKHQMRSKEVR
jgi:hypothetical protein